MKKALYALIVAVVLIISLIAHSFCFGTGDIVADIKGVYNDIFNDGITETKTFSELKFDYSLFETSLDESEYYNYHQLISKIYLLWFYLLTVLYYTSLYCRLCFQDTL